MDRPDRNYARRILYLLLFAFSFLVNNARATLTTWDPQGTTAGDPYTGSLTGSWEDASWSTSETGQATPQAWVENTAALFAVNAGAGTPAFTLTMNSNHTVAGIFDGPLTPNPCTVTIAGAGVMTIPSGLQGFAISSDTGDPGSVTISNTIAGPGTITTEYGGQLYLNGSNTWTGGTSLGYSGSTFTGIVYFLNGNAFGTGTIIVSNTGGLVCALYAETASAVTIPNAFNVGLLTGGLNIVGNAAGVTFSGNWVLPQTADLGAGGTGNLVILGGVMSGAGGLNKFNPSTLRLTGANTYTGSTIVSNGTLALGSTGSINNSARLVLVPGANDTVFDVTAIQSYTLGNSTTLVGLGTGTGTTTAANIKGASGGTVNLGSRPVMLNFVPTGFSGDTAHPPLYISQGALTFNNNTITVTNSAATALGLGTYRLIQVGNGSSGTINGVPNATPSIKGTGINSNAVASLVVSNGNLNLVVKPISAFTNFSLSESNTIGIGATAVTLSGRVSASSVYPAKSENIGVNLNGTVATTTTVNDTTGDFSYTFAPSAVAYSSNPYTNTFSYNGDGALGPATNGNYIVPPNGFYTNDALPGFFSGLNLFFTNKAGIPMYTWSSTNTGLPVAYWNLEGPMQEQPLNDGSGNSRYSINVTPSVPLIYYISGPSVNWPYLSPAGVNWIITDDQGDYTYASTNNVSITIAGVLGLPVPPVILQQPTNLTVLAGKNVSFNVVATGSQPMTYQWFFNTNTSLGTNSVLSLAGVTSNNVGSYAAFITNQYGSVTSLTATLSVVLPPEIAVQSIAGGVEMSGTAVPGEAYWVQSASNLTPPVVWTTVTTGSADSNGLVQFTDTGVLTNSTLFYRFAFP